MTTARAEGLDGRLDSLEPPYRSRGETQVGRVLDRYGIPFFYEQATLIYDRGRYRIWHPDFTLPHHDGMVIEYAGMMNVPDYAAGIRHKRRAYAANGIPALFVYPEELTGSRWPERLFERIDSFRSPEDAAAYSARASSFSRHRYRQTS